MLVFINPSYTLESLIHKPLFSGSPGVIKKPRTKEGPSPPGVKFPIQSVSMHQSFFGGKPRNRQGIDREEMCKALKAGGKAISGRETLFSLICRSLIVIGTFYWVVGLLIPSDNPLECVSSSVLQTRYYCGEITNPMSHGPGCLTPAFSPVQYCQQVCCISCVYMHTHIV